MALIPPFFLDCVTAIGFRDLTDQIAFGATGFLFGKMTKPQAAPEQNEYHIYLVTNRHVFEGKRSGVLRFNPTAGAAAKTYDLSLVDAKGSPVWSAHPNAEVDAAATPINIQLLQNEGIQFGFFHSDNHVLTRKDAAAEGISEGDGIFVLGFPLGDVGKERNYVVVRHGIIARIRDALAGAADAIVIDATVFPGNSGGPVVTRPEAVAITGTKAFTKARLLGMVSGYVPYQDVAYSKQTDRPRVIFEENTGLAVVVPSDQIIEVVDKAHERMMKEIHNKGAA